jgi:probable DNA repair protein
VSIGPALIEYPMIAAALDVLRLTQGRPAAALVGSLLRAPFLGGAETEQIPRARLDAHLRERGEPRFSLERLRRGPARSSCPDLSARLAVLLERRIPLRSRAAPSRWAERFASWLEAMGWPGERSLGSDEYQLLERWRVLLDELAGLDAVRPEIDGAEALDRLSGAAAREVFQPRSPETPVQVLGVLEAAGLSFDGLWFAGLHDEAWPPAAHPSPFLPLGLQREHQVPGSSPGRTARWAQKVTDRLLGSAPEIVLSAPGLDGERELRPSPLLVRHPLADAGEVAALPLRRLSHELRRDDAVETVSDGRGPQVASGDPVRGGTSLFADQAACPFRGFAHHRLRARALEDHGRGVDARVRGTLVHGTLERLWTRLQGGAALEETDPQGLAAQVEACAEEAVEDEARRRPESLSPRFVELEVARLVAAVGRLLARERERAPFEVVRRESLETLEIGGVSVHVRPDRVDRLGSGGLAVLDYKTGDPRSLGWFEERLEEPQLPIYATGLRGERIDAVALVHVRPDAATLKGVAREEGVLPGVNAFVQSREVELFGDFDGLLAHWRQWLEALADEVRRGEAAVAPKKPPQTCRYCDLRALCRVDERLGWHPHDAAEPDAEPSGAGADDG